LKRIELVGAPIASVKYDFASLRAHNRAFPPPMPQRQFPGGGGGFGRGAGRGGA
jgi:hypothetical protein